jgi:hypothetical protein
LKACIDLMQGNLFGEALVLPWIRKEDFARLDTVDQSRCP